MLSPRWRKVLRDLWVHRSRSLLVVLSIAVGLIAVGAIGGARAHIAQSVGETYPALKPASIRLLGAPFGNDVVEAVRALEAVEEAAGRRTMRLRVQQPDGEWANLELWAAQDWGAHTINKVRPEVGAWPPPDGHLVLERTSLAHLGVTVGDRLAVETEGGRRLELPIAGTGHDMHVIPAGLTGRSYGYISFATLEILGQPPAYNELLVTVAERATDERHLTAVADQVADLMEQRGAPVLRRWIPEPGKPPLDAMLSTFLLILSALGYFMLAMSGFLVVNTVSALVAQQVRQIGVMKAVGARPLDVALLYLGGALGYGVLALALGIPLGAVGAAGLSGLIAAVINLEVANNGIIPTVLAEQVALGLLLPGAAALLPVLGAARTTVREAISATGLSPGAQGGSMTRIRFLPRPLLLSLRNTFRRKARLALTLAALTLGGALFISVFSLRASLLATLDQMSGYWAYDVEVNLTTAQPAGPLLELLRGTEGVTAAEAWGYEYAFVNRPDGSRSRNEITKLAPPAGSAMIHPTLLAGRWLESGDSRAAVINTDLLKAEPDLRLGGDLVLNQEHYHIVGIATSQIMGPIAYVPAEGAPVRRLVATTSYPEAAAKRLEERLASAGYLVEEATTGRKIRQTPEQMFNLLVGFLLLMAMLMALVGGLGLTGSMSLSVLERTREIGVMRAVGASNTAVISVVLAEAATTGLLSWALGTVLAWPLGWGLSAAVGVQFLNAPLSYTFAPAGALLWLGVALLLSAIAAWLPARRASRLSVREVLSYE